VLSEFGNPTNAVSFIRSYNSQRLENIGLGIGWRHSFQRSLVLNDDVLNATSATGSGNIWRNVNGVWEGDADSDVILVQNETRFLLTKANNEIEEYDLQVRLLSQTNTDGQVTVYAYNDDDQLASITNHYGGISTIIIWYL